MTNKKILLISLLVVISILIIVGGIFLGIFIFNNFYKDDFYEIEFIVDGEVYTTKKNNKKSFTPPQMTNYEWCYFDGWYLDSNFETEYNNFDDIKNLIDKKLYGKYVYTKFYISLIIDGKVYSQSAYDSMDDFDLSLALQKEGYEFVGWYLNDKLLSEDNFKNYFNEFAGYELVAKYQCLHINLSEEYGFGATCTEEGVWCQKCLECDEQLEVRDGYPALGHEKFNTISYDNNSHFYYCTRCPAKVDVQNHTMTNADCCSGCAFYIADTPMQGSKITSLAKRDCISNDFINIPNLIDGNLELVAVDVGQGDCIFIKFPDGKTMVMDAGTAYLPPLSMANHYDRLVDVLNEYSVNQIDYLFITHSDYDHVRYLDKLLKDYEIKNIYIPKAEDDITNTYEDVIKAVSKEYYNDNGVQKKSAIRYNIGDFQIAGTGWRMKCYTYLSKDYPYVGKKTDSTTVNAISPICLLEYAGRTIVLTGDSNEQNEEYLVNRGVFDGLDADILKVAHHGSKTSTTNEFLTSVKCEYAIISHGGLYGHPTPEVMTRLNNNNYQSIFETQAKGNIRVVINANGLIDFDFWKNETTNSSENLQETSLQITEKYCINKKEYYKLIPIFDAFYA